MVCRVKRISIWLLAVLPMFATLVEAGVFSCVKANGAIEFRDRPCETSQEQQSFLPHQYQKTDPKAVQKQARQQERQLETLTVSERKEARLVAKAEKKREKTAAAAERRHLRCERLDERIAKLERELKQGKKIKTYQRLQAELEHAELMKKRYCTVKS